LDKLKGENKTCKREKKRDRKEDRERIVYGGRIDEKL